MKTFGGQTKSIMVFFKVANCAKQPWVDQTVQVQISFLALPGFVVGG